MQTVLFGFRRTLLRIPWRLFQLGVRRATAHSGRLDPDQRQVHHFVVREMPAWTRPMPPEHIASGVGLPVERVNAILDMLERRLIYLFREGGRDVIWAYPVTAAETPHHLAFSSGERIDAA